MTFKFQRAFNKIFVLYLATNMEYIPYKGDSEVDMWLYLDKLERLNLDMNAYTDIFDVMEKISQDISGLRCLVERYSNTGSIHVFGYVAAAISHFTRVVTGAVNPNPVALEEIAKLTFKVVAQ